MHYPERAHFADLPPAIFILLHAACLGPEAVQQSAKAPIRWISNQTWAIPSFLHPLQGPLAIIDKMKVTDGEYEEIVRMDGPLVRPRQSSQRGDINMHLHVYLLKGTFNGGSVAAVCFLI